jgi:hypothetical protein
MKTIYIIFALTFSIGCTREITRTEKIIPPPYSANSSVQGSVSSSSQCDSLIWLALQDALNFSASGQDELADWKMQNKIVWGKLDSIMEQEKIVMEENGRLGIENKNFSRLVRKYKTELSLYVNYKPFDYTFKFSVPELNVWQRFWLAVKWTLYSAPIFLILGVVVGVSLNGKISGIVGKIFHI